MIRVYKADIGCLLNGDLFDASYKRMDPMRKSRIDSVKPELNKRQILLEYAFAECGKDYREASFALGQYDKPYVQNMDVSFNISHSNDKVMCVFSPSLVDLGCDVEKDKKDGSKIAERFFTEEEFLYLRNVEEEDERKTLFTRLWTMKESFIKAVGEGLSLPLNDFSLIKDGKICESISRDGKTFSFREYPTEGDYHFTLCYQEGACGGMEDKENTVGDIEEIFLDKVLEKRGLL